MKGNRYLLDLNGGTARCALPDGSFALVSSESIPLLETRTWCKGGNGYAMARSVAPAVSMQRFLMNAKEGEIVDHIDGDPLNNTLENLRIATKQENAMNAKLRSDNGSGYKGVAYHKKSGKYRAYIYMNGKQVHLGLFETAEEASQQYATAATLAFGEFYRKE